MWMPAGVGGVIRCLPRRAGGAVATWRTVRVRSSTTRTVVPTGRASAMSLPQSGMTNCDGQVEEAVPELFEHGSVGSGRATASDPDHSLLDPATRT